jgi:hypothetical protein
MIAVPLEHKGLKNECVLTSSGRWRMILLAEQTVYRNKQIREYYLVWWDQKECKGVEGMGS